MPIDMAVEEPRPRVISNKTNRDFISRTANADYVTHYRVVIVIGTVPCTANDVESMAMKMDRMLSTGVEQLECQNGAQTHRTATRSSRNGQLHHVTVAKSIDTSSRNEILSTLRAGQNLE